MTNTDLDARAARAMGYAKKEEGDLIWTHKDGLHCKCRPFVSIGAHWTSGLSNWSPTTDANHFEEMLREIERKKLFEEYASQLSRQCGSNFVGGALVHMTCLFATPETRVLAACEALEAAR